MTFQIIAISSLLAFYGCYLGKNVATKKAGNPDRPAGTNGAGSLRPTTTFCLAMGRRVEGLAFWCIRIGLMAVGQNGTGICDHPPCFPHGG